MLQCVAVCCSVLQCVAVRDVLQCVAACCSASQVCSELQCEHGQLVCMRWLQLVGSLKSQVSFAKEPYKRDDILQKSPIILRSLLIVAPHMHNSMSYLNLHI